jgi:SAM-dependent methyltransferase
MGSWPILAEVAGFFSELLALPRGHSSIIYIATSPTSYPMKNHLISKIKTNILVLLSTALLGNNKGPHLTRFYMYQRLRNVCSAINSPDIKVLSISNSQDLTNVIGLSNTVILNACYPEYDILSLPFKDESFDVVVSDQVLEHIRGDPQIAINETRRVLRKGGIAVHTTCFMNPIHEHPIDMWRFTPSSLEYLCRGWGEIIECGGWGNKVAFLCINLGLRMIPIPHAIWHPLHKLAIADDKNFPIVTWIVAVR